MEHLRQARQAEQRHRQARQAEQRHRSLATVLLMSTPTLAVCSCQAVSERSPEVLPERRQAPDRLAAFGAPWVLLRAELQQGMRRITDAGQKLTWVNAFDNNMAVLTLPATQVELGVQHIAQWYGSRCLVVRRRGLNGAHQVARPRVPAVQHLGGAARVQCHGGPWTAERLRSMILADMST